jgi:hypothetical protein
MLVIITTRQSDIFRRQPSKVSSEIELVGSIPEHSANGWCVGIVFINALRIVFDANRVTWHLG